jgi:hypothetical protein
MRSQGFGKRKSAVGMPRPKKQKLQNSDGMGQPSATVISAATAKEEVSPPALKEQDTPTLDGSLEVVDKAMLKEAAALTKLARSSVKESAAEVRVAAAKLRHERRLDEERERRWWAAERREEAPPAYLQLERAYKSKVRDLEARLEVSEAQRCEAEARAELQGCLLLQEQLAHARLRDRLCGEVV